jgi:hypothetical protein
MPDEMVGPQDTIPMPANASVVPTATLALPSKSAKFELSYAQLGV